MTRARTPLLAGLVTAAVLLASSAAVDGFRLEAEGSDISLYTRYAALVLDGRVPYRDFFFEYPPGALAAIVTSMRTAKRVAKA